MIANPSDCKCKALACAVFVGTAGLNSAGAEMSVSCGCCVLSGRGVCDWLIARPEVLPSVVCLIECHHEVLVIRRPWPTTGSCFTGENTGTSSNFLSKTLKIKVKTCYRSPQWLVFIIVVLLSRLSSDHDNFSQGLYAGGPCSVLYPTHSPIYS
jgi:hypothetical protein